jgi:hypothetical protein
MSTPTLRSAYPPSLDELLPKARDLADRLGQVPSRNRLMREFRVGSPKATALREALQRGGPDPASPTPNGSTPADGPVDGPAPDPGPADRANGSTPPAPATADTGAADGSALVIPSGHPAGREPARPVRAASAARTPVRLWPLWLLAAPAMVAIWSGWVGLGSLTGFGMVRPLPGIADGFEFNSAITLPVGVETYAAFALRVWLSGAVPARARRFARWSAISSLALGALGQVAYHLMAAAGMTSAPWPITTGVACLPVAVLGMGAALAHLLHTTDD